MAKLNWKMSRRCAIVRDRTSSTCVFCFLQQFHYRPSEIQSQSIPQRLTDLLWRSTNKSKTRGLGDTTHVVFGSFMRGKIKVSPPDQSLRQHSRNDMRQIEKKRKRFVSCCSVEFTWKVRRYIMLSNYLPTFFKS